MVRCLVHPYPSPTRTIIVIIMLSCSRRGCSGATQTHSCSRRSCSGATQKHKMNSARGEATDHHSFKLPQPSGCSQPPRIPLPNQSSSRQIIIKQSIIRNRDLPLGVITARRPTKRSQPCSRYLNKSSAPSLTRPRESKRDLPPTGSDFSGCRAQSAHQAPITRRGRETHSRRPVSLPRAQGEARRPTKSSARRPHRSAKRDHPQARRVGPPRARG